MMTIGSEALPQPGETDQTIVAGAETPPAAPVETDPDVLELQNAEAAAKAEEAAAAGTTEIPPAPGAAAPPAAAKATSPSEKSEPAPVPYAAFAERNAKLREVELENARLKGRLEAVTPPAAPHAPAAPAAPTPQDRLAELRAEKNAAAKQFDDGEITAAQLEAKRDEIEDKIAGIREEQLLAKVPKQTPAASTDDGLFLHQQTEQVVTQHPWVDVFEKVGTDADWDYVRSLAKADMQERGVDMANKAVADLELRKTMGRLMDQLGPTNPLITQRAQKAGITLPTGQPKPPTTATTPPGKPAPSPVALARAAKLDLAASAPVNLSSLGGATGDDGMPSAAAIEAMTDEEIAALPRGVQDKILSATAA